MASLRYGILLSIILSTVIPFWAAKAAVNPLVYSEDSGQVLISLSEDIEGSDEIRYTTENLSHALFQGSITELLLPQSVWDLMHEDGIRAKVPRRIQLFRSEKKHSILLAFCSEDRIYVLVREGRHFGKLVSIQRPQPTRPIVRFDAENAPIFGESGYVGISYEQDDGAGKTIVIRTSDQAVAVAKDKYFSRPLIDYQFSPQEGLPKSSVSPADFKHPVELETGHSPKKIEFVYREIERLNLQLKTPYMTPEEVENLKRLNEDPGLEESDKARQSFEIDLRARLRLLDPIVATKVWKFYVSKEWNYYPSEKIHANGGLDPFSPGFVNVKIQIPARYKDSWVFYAILRHEFEHVIQFFSFIAHPEWGIHFTLLKDLDKFGDTPYWWNTTRFLTEDGAMRAEWRFMQFVSPAEVHRLAAMIDSDPALKPEAGKDQHFFRRMISARSLSVDEYLFQERVKFSRYFDVGYRIYAEDQKKRGVFDSGREPSYSPLMLKDLEFSRRLFQLAPDARKLIMVLQAFGGDKSIFTGFRQAALIESETLPLDEVLKYFKELDKAPLPEAILKRWLERVSNGTEIPTLEKDKIRSQYKHLLESLPEPMVIPAAHPVRCEQIFR